MNHPCALEQKEITATPEKKKENADKENTL